MKVNQLQMYSLIITFVVTKGQMSFRFYPKMVKLNFKKKIFGRSKLLIIEMFLLFNAQLMLSNVRLMNQMESKAIGIFFLENNS